MIHLILLVFAFVCETLAVFNVGSRWNLVAAGLAFFFLSLIFGGVSHVEHLPFY